MEIKIETIEDVKVLNPKTHAIKISRRLGAKKRMALVDYAQSRNIKILNLGISQREMESLEARLESTIEGLEDEFDEDFEDFDEL